MNSSVSFLAVLILVCTPGLSPLGRATPVTLTRAWSATGVTIGTRSDGWIELRAITPGRLDLGAGDRMHPVAIATPSEVGEWVARMRAAFSRRPSDSAALTLGAAAFGLTVKPAGSPSDSIWQTSLCGVRMGYATPPPRRLLDFLDSAVAAARSARAEPVAVDVTAPRDLSDVACAPAAFTGTNLMPVDPGPRTGNDTLRPLETLARFVVRVNGTVDPASITFYPSLGSDNQAVAIAAIARWSWAPAKRGGADVPQWVHRIIHFASPPDGVETPRAGGSAGELPSAWRANGDGFVEWRDSANRVRELFTPDDIDAWLAEVKTMRDRAAGGVVVPGSPGRLSAVVAWSPWYALLGDRNGRRVSVEYHQNNGRAQIGLAVGECGIRPDAGSLRGDSAVDRSLANAALATRTARAAQSRPRVDAARIYGESETTCPASRLDDATASTVTDDSIRTTLALPRDALTAFVIDRDGVVDPQSVYVFGDWSGGERSRIVRAVSSLRYTPPRVSGQPVAQRGHYLIAAALPSMPARDEATQACVNRGDHAVLVRVVSPGVRALRSDLERASISFPVGGYFQIISNGGGPRIELPSDGTLGQIWMPDGSGDMGHWIVPPTPPATREPYGGWNYAALPMRTDGRAVGVEESILARCP